MLVHEFIDGDKPVMVLIHGVLTPWQIWMPHITEFNKSYNVYAIALNAHTEERASEFVSVSAEAEEIIHYFQMKNIETIDILCGISLGGKIAHEIWQTDKLTIRNLILDGAPLVPCPGFAIKIMIKNYKNIVHKSKIRDPKVIENFKKYFLPEIYLENYIKIADLMTDISIDNMVNSAFSESKIGCGNHQIGILFLHGTKGNEILSKKSAKILKKHYPAMKVVCFKGDAHCYKAIYQPEKWIGVVKDFLNDK